MFWCGVVYMAIPLKIGCCCCCGVGMMLLQCDTFELK